MKIKNLSLLIGVLFSLFAPFSSAASSYVPSVMKEFLSDIFVVVPGDIQTSSIGLILYFKILLFFLIFAIAFTALKKALSAQKNIVGTIALIFALISVIGMPNSWVVFIFVAYSWLAAALLLLLPFILYFVAKGKVPDGIWRCVFILVIALILAAISAYFLNSGENSGQYSNNYTTAGEWTAIAAVVFFILALICFLTHMGSHAHGEHGGHNNGHGGGGHEEKKKKKKGHDDDHDVHEWNPEIIDVDPVHNKLKGKVKE